MGANVQSAPEISRVPTSTHSVKPVTNEEDIIPFVMPMYFTKAPISKEELTAALKAWKMILNNQSPHFFKLKETDPTFTHNNCVEYFYDVFYTRQFDVHPISKNLFHRSINKQGSFLIRMISMLVGDLEDPEKWNKTLENLANIHNKMGIKACEYGIFGEILLYSIRKCIGDEAFTTQVSNGWAKIFSKILATVVPLVVRFELKNKDMAQKIADKRSTMHSTVASVFIEDNTKRSGALEHSISYGPSKEHSVSQAMSIPEGPEED